ncbi:MAG TPA: hypothetical protein VIR30_02570 [Nocardioides sp.]
MEDGGLGPYEREQAAAARAAQAQLELPGVRAALLTVAAAAEAIQPDVEAALRAAEAAVRAIQPSLVASQEIATSLAAWWSRVAPDLEAAVRAIRRALPPNWDPGRLEATMDLALSGWPVVWAPRSGVIARLLDADDEAERNAVLVDAAPDILEDVESLLLQVAGAGASPLVDSLQEAVDAGRYGLWKPVQATATTVLDALVARDTDAKRHMEEIRSAVDPEDAPLVELRLALVLAGLPRAFQSFRPATGEAVPKAYNRHATIHSPTYEQLTQSNALFALLMAGGLLRELHEYGDQEISIAGLVIRADLSGEGVDP